MDDVLGEVSTPFQAEAECIKSKDLYDLMFDRNEDFDAMFDIADDLAADRTTNGVNDSFPINNLPNRSVFQFAKNFLHTATSDLLPCIVVAGRLATAAMKSQKYKESLIKIILSSFYINKTDSMTETSPERTQKIVERIDSLIEKGFFVSVADFSGAATLGYTFILRQDDARKIYFHPMLIQALSNFTYGSARVDETKEKNAGAFLAAKLMHEATHWLVICCKSKYFADAAGRVKKDTSPICAVGKFFFKDLGDAWEQLYFGGIIRLIEAEHPRLTGKFIKFSIAGLSRDVFASCGKPYVDLVKPIVTRQDFEFTFEIISKLPKAAVQTVLVDEVEPVFNTRSRTTYLRESKKRARYFEHVDEFEEVEESTHYPTALSNLEKQYSATDDSWVFDAIQTGKIR